MIRLYTSTTLERLKSPGIGEHTIEIMREVGFSDTEISALRDAKAQGQTTIAIVNVAESSIAREADIVLPTYAGPEIGVASTKAFTCQLAALASFAIAAGQARGTLPVMVRA